MDFKLVLNKKNSNSSKIESSQTSKINFSKQASISHCIEQIKSKWKSKSNLASLTQDWEGIAGKQIASNCSPIFMRNKVLTIGANQPQWRQALLYNKPQLIAALNAAGYPLKEIRIQQHYQEKKEKPVNEKDIWNKHPSRIDIHGISKCKKCDVPAPLGELILWGKCSFCRRKEFKID